MITIQVTSQDLANLRFAYRPLMEIPLSFRVLLNANFQSPYRWWIDEVQRTLYNVELPYLSALVNAHGYIPDFMTPTPTSRCSDIEAEFEVLLATPDEVIRGCIRELIAEHGDSEMRRFFLAHPREAVHCLVEEMRFYWQKTLAHYWSRMVNVLEGDVLYRARTLALDGPKPLFDDLHSTVTYQQQQIKLEPACQHRSTDVDFALQGDGIQLVPVIFRGCGRMFQLTPEWQPMLAYGVRGAGLWNQARPKNHSLEYALGAMRARTLQRLSTPATTTELAHKMQLTVGTVSQHLTRLNKAGLVEPHRSGKCVYYHLTERGEHLLALFEASD